MATVSITLNDTMVGTIVSPGPDQYIARLEKTSTTPYVLATENWFALPRPHGIWRAGRLVLRQGDGQRIISFSGIHTTDVRLLTPTRFLGNLVLECLPLGETWRIDFSDTAVSAQSQAA